MFVYCASGLSLHSEIALPGLIPVAADHPPDATVRFGPVPAALENPSASGPTWYLAGSRFLLCVPGVARFLVQSGTDIIVEAEPGAPESGIAIFVVGTVFGILLHQREHIVLHASTVRVNDRAVLFCGPSGMGKSTMAAALGERGFDLVTDDLCVITTTAGVPHVQPDGRLIRLWAETIDKLDLAGRRRAAVRGEIEKYYVEPASSVLKPLPLGAVYLLREARPPHSAGIQRPNAVDAIMAIRRSAYRAPLVTRMGQRANYFHAATSIANRAGIFHLTRPLDFASMPEVMDGLERHWSEIGLLRPVA